MGLNYDGINDTVNVTHYSDIALTGTSVFTVSMWVKPDTFTSASKLITKENAASGTWRFGVSIVVTTGQVQACTSQSCVGTTTINGDSIDTTKYHHIVYICNSGQKLIVNNGTSTTGSQQAGTGTSNPVNIGHLISTGQFFDGNIAEVAMWVGVELTANEITALFRGAKPSSIRPASLKMYLPFHTVASGSTGNEAPIATKNNGTVTGAIQSDHAPVRNNQSYYGKESQ